ncbi:MAG TPA: hypothetical protein VL912_09415, partial [Candidatus Udaeobacter sp.]|nr:hypothetical protein [Candidatus Udaeobacter sp.]
MKSCATEAPSNGNLRAILHLDGRAVFEADNRVTILGGTNDVTASNLFANIQSSRFRIGNQIE